MILLLFASKCINIDSIRTTTAYINVTRKELSEKMAFVQYSPQMIKLHSKFNIEVLNMYQKFLLGQRVYIVLESKMGGSYLYPIDQGRVWDRCSLEGLTKKSWL